MGINQLKRNGTQNKAGSQETQQGTKERIQNDVINLFSMPKEGKVSVDAMWMNTADVQAPNVMQAANFDVRPSEQQTT